MSSATSQLLPCPFCGGTPFEVPQDVGGVIRCGDCQARTASNDYAEAVRHWNRRVDARSERTNVDWANRMLCPYCNPINAATQETPEAADKPSGTSAGLGSPAAAAPSRGTNTQAERLHDPREDKTPPTQARLPWIVQMMWDAGLYTQAREVQRLGDAYFALSSTTASVTNTQKGTPRTDALVRAATNEPLSWEQGRIWDLAHQLERELAEKVANEQAYERIVGRRSYEEVADDLRLLEVLQADAGTRSSSSNFEQLQRQLTEAHERESEAVSETIDYTVGVPFMRCSPGLAKYIAALEDACDLKRDENGVTMGNVRLLREEIASLEARLSSATSFSIRRGLLHVMQDFVKVHEPANTQLLEQIEEQIRAADSRVPKG